MEPYENPRDPPVVLPNLQKLTSLEQQAQEIFENDAKDLLRAKDEIA